MTYYYDTSALIKNYVDEIGSEFVAELLDGSNIVYVSEITLLECFSTLRRVLSEKLIKQEDYDCAKKEITTDFHFFTIIDIDATIPDCERLIDIYQLKTLDSIQLSSVSTIKNDIDGFVCCDAKLVKAGEEEGIKVINPLDRL